MAATASILGTQLTINSDSLPTPSLYGIPLGSGNFPELEDQVLPCECTYVLTNRAGQDEDTVPDPESVLAEPIGITTNGLLILSPSLGSNVALPNGGPLPPPGFQHNKVFNLQLFGVDECGGYPDHDGMYVVHNGSFLTRCWGRDMANSNTYYSSSHYNGDFFRHPDGHSKIIGFSLDGFPIYGPFSYEDRLDQKSNVLRMRSSYRPYPTPIPGRPSYATTAVGAFIQDYEYVEGYGALDFYNGRWGLTPEYPSGTYAYFLTMDELNRPQFPYVVGRSTRNHRVSTQHGHD